MKTLTVFSITLSATLLSGAVLSGEYDLIKGKGVEVCEAYKKNLESFDEPKPMMCERKINPEFTDFDKPIWEKVDLEEHRELFRRVLRYQGGDYNQFRRGYYDDAELDRNIKRHKEDGYRFISRTQFPLTPYGNRTSDILFYRSSPCPYDADAGESYATNLYVLTEAPGVQDAMIDAQSPMQKQLHSEISPNNGTNTDVGLFRYKGVPYIDRYCPDGGCIKQAKDTLMVFKYGPIPNPKPKYDGDEFNLGFKKICEYRYLDK